MGFRPHYLPDIVVTLVCFAAAAMLAYRARALQPRIRRNVRLALLAICMSVAVATAFATARVNRRFPGPVVSYVRLAGIVSAAFLLYSFPLIAAARTAGGFDPSRRRALKIGATAALAAPASVATFAFIHRDDLKYKEVDIRLPRHASALDGLRIVQLTDIHMGSFVSERQVKRALGMANEAKAHLAFVTGDLVTSKGDPLDSCLNIVRTLKAEAGVYGCNGNHEIYAEAENYVTEAGARFGMRILRQEAVPLQWNGATINLVGVDYQRRGSNYLEGVEDLIAPGAYNLLLSHNPDLFPVAAGKGFDLTVGGHTHGGQVTLEIIHPALNVVRFTTPFVHGLYERGESKLYVSRGIGTIGVPARLGAPPEVVCLRLCAT